MELFNIDKRTDIKPAPGKILISEPFLNDPRFYRSVILITNHDSEGTLGFVLNDRPRPDVLIKNAETDRSLFSQEAFDSQLSKGGPVGTEDLFVMHDAEDELGGHQVFQDICLGIKEHININQRFLDESIHLINPEINVKYFMGSSGWSGGQLEEEIKMGSWFVGESNKDLIFSTNFE